MTDARGDVQHHIGYAYHKLNDRRLMWIEYLEEKIESCRQRLRDSGKRVATQAQHEEAETPATVTEEREDEKEEVTAEEETGLPDEWEEETETTGEEESTLSDEEDLW